MDVDHNLNTAINKIREVLGDSAESPRFVETLPRRGYRFIGELKRPLPAVKKRPLHSQLSRSNRIAARTLVNSGWKIAAGALAIAVFALAAVVAYRWHRRSAGAGGPDVVPFTACPERRLPRLSLPMAPESHSRGTVIPCRRQRFRPVCEGNRERNPSPPDTASLGMDQSSMVSRRHADRLSPPGRR